MQHDALAHCPASDGGRVGTVLDGKIELRRLLGRGGMGEVYEGYNRNVGRRVAVKFMLPEFARQPEVLRRLEIEAMAAGGMEHENVAAVFDMGALPDGSRYLVMEFLEGKDLETLLAEEGPLPVARAAYILIQACRALDVVHTRRILHRDLKPGNLFLTKRADKTDLVKVLDFGIAKMTEATSAATRTGAAIGTAYYMSPEQARGERGIDARTDVYALGVILYELLSGCRPHEGSSLLEVLHSVMTREPAPLEQVRPGLPPGLYEVVRKAIARVASERFSSAAELGDALLPFAGRPLPPIRSDHGGVAVRAEGFAETSVAPASVRGEPASPGNQAEDRPGAAKTRGALVDKTRNASVVGMTRSAADVASAPRRRPVVAVVAALVLLCATIGALVLFRHQEAKAPAAAVTAVEAPVPVASANAPANASASALASAPTSLAQLPDPAPPAAASSIAREALPVTAPARAVAHPRSGVAAQPAPHATPPPVASATPATSSPPPRPSAEPSPKNDRKAGTAGHTDDY
jgi:serine/threonine-protein kinase